MKLVVLTALVMLVASCELLNPVITCGQLDRDVDDGVCVVEFGRCSDNVEYRVECVGEPATCNCVEDGVAQEDDLFRTDDNPCSLDDEEELERIVELGCGWPIEA